MIDKPESLIIEVELPGGDRLPVTGTPSLQEISEAVQDHYRSPIVAALVENELYELSTTVDKPALIRFVDLSEKEGRRIYRRSLIFLLVEAVFDLFPGASITVEHSLGRGVYCEVKKEPALDPADVAALEHRMRQQIESDRPFKKRKITPDEAKQIFNNEGFSDKATLLYYWPKDYLNVYAVGSMENTLHGYLVPRTGMLETFGLQYYKPGLILKLPAVDTPMKVAPFVEQKKLFGIFREAENWGTILGFDTVGAMNKLIELHRGPEMMRVAEALHEKKIAQIADMIGTRRHEISVILIAGPSSSGKTTFAQRLRIQLLVNGLRPLPISIDDYFVDRELTPLDESNNPDFEHIEAIDLPLFNEHLLRLIHGETVEIPVFNFATGRREYRGKPMRLEKNQSLIIEGIHGLNETLTRSIPRRQKFKIYISALTALNIDRHTPIHTTDTRLLRRIIRDAQFRGNSALETIRRWASVRRGEERNVFCLQEEADIMFNSALVYEPAIIKKQATLLLRPIDRSYPEYITAKRLLTLLSFFLPLEPARVPSNSILREFIGQSCFFEEQCPQQTPKEKLP